MATSYDPELGSSLGRDKEYEYIILKQRGAPGGVMVRALRYKPAGRGFDSRWCHWNFSQT